MVVDINAAKKWYTASFILTPIDDCVKDITVAISEHPLDVVSRTMKDGCGCTILFYAEIDPISYNRFKQRINPDVDAEYIKLNKRDYN